MIAPHQTRNALENVLIEMRIAGVFRNDTQDRHQTVENVFVSWRQRLPSSDNDSHNTFEKYQHWKQIIELNEKNIHFIKWSFSATFSGVWADSILVNRASVKARAESWMSACANLVKFTGR